MSKVVGDEDVPLRSVQVDALVLLKVMKDCRDRLPALVTGQLCGLDVGGTMQVTHCFPYLTKDHEGEVELVEGTQYQLDMLRHLRDVNIDSNTVGWYQSSFFGDFLTTSLIETMFNYQDSIPKSLLLVFDPMQSAVGKGAFKALRLTTEFMELFRESKQQRGAAKDLLTRMPSSRILEEYPVTVHNSALVDAFLLHWMAPTSAAAVEPPMQSSTGENYDLDSQSVLEKNVQFLLDCLDELSNQQWRLHQHERTALRQQQQQKAFVDKRRQENALRRERGEDLVPEAEAPAFKKLAAPSQLDTLLISNQIQSYCKHINSFAGDSLCKLFLVGGFSA